MNILLNYKEWSNYIVSERIDVTDFESRENFHVRFEIEPIIKWKDLRTTIRDSVVAVRIDQETKSKTLYNFTSLNSVNQKSIQLSLQNET